MEDEHAGRYPAVWLARCESRVCGISAYGGAVFFASREPDYQLVVGSRRCTWPFAVYCPSMRLARPPAGAKAGRWWVPPVRKPPFGDTFLRLVIAGMHLGARRFCLHLYYHQVEAPFAKMICVAARAKALGASPGVHGVAPEASNWSISAAFVITKRKKVSENPIIIPARI